MSRRPRARTVLLAPFAAALIGPAALAGPASAQTISVDAVRDAVSVSGLPVGPAALQLSRPDATTGAPVVLGVYSDNADPVLPFTVNLTAPTPGNPSGDCWESPAVPGSQTPDIRPGDTVSVGGASVTVPANAATEGAGRGPFPGCEAISPFAEN